MNLPVLSLIVAVSDNGVIGREGGLPWRLPEDLKWFKARTMGKPIIMGRKTWESFPKRPLPGRTNIIVTRQASYVAPDAVVAPSLDAALDLARRENPDEIMIIGGAQLYAQALGLVTRIYLTQVAVTIEGDAFFPAFDRSTWRERVEGVYPSSATQPIGYSFIILERKDFTHEHA
jgi:dihydrofolate reductase